MFFQDSFFRQFDSTIECGLAAETEEYPVGLLILNDLFDEFGSNWNRVDLVSKFLVSVNRRDVGIHYDGLNSFFSKGFYCLRCRVVKFPCFAYLDRSAADNENFLEFADLQLEGPPSMNWSNRNLVS